jgi:hypothetical protein
MEMIRNNRIKDRQYNDQKKKQNKMTNNDS